MELPNNDEQQTMMTNSEVEDEEIEDMAEDMDEADEVKGKRTAALKNGNGHALKNGNGKMLNGSKNGDLTNGALKQQEAQQA